MATIDKAVELLEKVLEENYKLSEGYEIKPETRDEIEEWIKWHNDYKKRVEADTTNENSGLHLQLVSQQRELFYNFITWYNAKPFVKKPKDGLITTTIIEEYLKL